MGPLGQLQSQFASGRLPFIDGNLRFERFAQTADKLSQAAGSKG
jgi:hypothetical protein